MLRETTPRYPHVAIRASAGAGKTYQLTTRFLALLFAGESPDRILATTFTRKAAGEILERVLVRLAAGVTDDAKRVELADQLRDTDIDRARVLDAQRRLIAQLHRVRICTLDSFFGSLAGAFGLEAGLPPTYGVLEADRDEALRGEALQAALRTHGIAPLQELLRSTAHGEASQRVIERALEIVEALHPLYCETPASAWSVEGPVGFASDAALRAACDAIAALRIPHKRHVTAREEDLARASREEWDALLEKGLAGCIARGDLVYYTKPIEPPVCEAYAPLVAHARARVLDRIARQTRASYALLEAFDREYHRLKSAARALRFDDVTRALAERALASELDDVYFRLDGRIAHILLDEFQDTARGQWNVLRPFAEEVVAHGDDLRSFFCVGDVKQAIYGWRGGAAEIFETLGEQLPSVAWEPMDVSRRSAPEVIDLVNRVFGAIASNPALDAQREGAARWAASFTPHATVHTARQGHVLVATFADEARRFDETAEHVARVAAASPNASVGILVRTNAGVARTIDALRARGVVASQEGGNPLSDSAAVGLVLSALALADHPGDRAAHFHLAHAPIAAALGIARDASEEQRAADSLRLRRAIADRGAAGFVRDLARTITPFCDARDRARLQQLVDVTDRAPATERVDAFRARILAARVDDPAPSPVRVMTVHQAKGLEFDIVVLADLDRMKFDRKYVRMLVERSRRDGTVRRVMHAPRREVLEAFPDLVALENDAQAQLVRETLSVLYVALTRAVSALHVLLPPSEANERKVPASAGGVVRAAFCGTAPVAASATLFESGRTPREEPATVPPVVESTASPMRLPPQPAVRTRGLARVRPSDLTHRDARTLGDAFRTSSAAARARGVLVHLWLSQIVWLDAPPPTDATLRALARTHGFDDARIEHTLVEFRAMLERSAVRATFTRPAASAVQRIDVEHELPFAVRAGDALLVGTFDRVVFVRDGGRVVRAHFVEFKTQALERGDARALHEAVAEHEPQVRAYREALARVTHLAPSEIEATLLFLTPGVAAVIPPS